MITVAKEQDEVAPSEADSQPPSAVQTWTDPRLLFMWIMPLGTLVWGGLGVFVFYTVVFVYQPQDIMDKIGMALVTLFAVSTSFWVVYGNSQALFFELRERFIVWRLIWDGKVFQVWGYYLKRASYSPADVIGVERVILSERWFQKRIGSFLSRNTRFTQPHGKHINLRLTLADGRVFYLPGELGYEGQWKDEDVVQMREWMERLAEENQKSERLP